MCPAHPSFQTQGNSRLWISPIHGSLKHDVLHLLTGCLAAVTLQTHPPCSTDQAHLNRWPSPARTCSMGAMRHRTFHDVCRELAPGNAAWISETEHSKGSQSIDSQWHVKLCRGASMDAWSSCVSNGCWSDNVPQKGALRHDQHLPSRFLCHWCTNEGSCHCRLSKLFLSKTTYES